MGVNSSDEKTNLNNAADGNTSFVNLSGDSYTDDPVRQQSSHVETLRTNVKHVSNKITQIFYIIQCSGE